MRRALLGGIVGISLLGHLTSFAQQQTDFGTFLKELQWEASKKGLPEDILNRAVGNMTEPLPDVLKRLETQPESTFVFSKYFNSIVSDLRVKNGINNYNANKADLERISAKYGVPAENIVAMWGIETAYGKFTGGFEILPSLATLAYASHRKEFFRKELFAALQIVDEGHKPAHDMSGSWAGAMGQCQFMPTSFLAYAQDGNGDGKKDIWTTLPDVFASAANYLKKHGWNEGEKWGERVTLTKYLPANLKLSKRGLSDWKSVEEWKALGVAPKKGHFPEGVQARLFLPEGPSGRAWLTYNNFGVVMRWNNSTYFAVSALTLADEIAKGKE